MALVAYDNSDSSDYEDESNENPITLKTELEVPKPPVASPSSPSKEDGPSLFNLLPQPSTKKRAVIEEDDEFLHKKAERNVAKPKAKIMVPSLSDFKDVEHSIPITKPKTSNGKKSGLLGMLPQPRNAVTATTKSLIPHVLTQKPNTLKNVPQKKTKVDMKLLNKEFSDESDNEEVVNDFFSINKVVEIPEHVEVPIETENMSNVSKPRGIEAFFKKDVEVLLEPDYAEADHSGESSSYDGGSQNHNNEDVVLNEEAIMKLCGTRGKRKREDIQIVDVNQQEVLADAREWLLKGLMDDTTKRVSASKKKGHEPTSQQKRKHQITYLAYQAKANEAELQNQWANNRMSKRQTQAKYGF